MTTGGGGAVQVSVKVVLYIYTPGQQNLSGKLPDPGYHIHNQKKKKKKNPLMTKESPACNKNMMVFFPSIGEFRYSGAVKIVFKTKLWGTREYPCNLRVHVSTR